MESRWSLHSDLYGNCLSPCCDNNGEKCLFWLLTGGCDGHHGKGGSWLHCIYSQEAEGDEGWCKACFLLFLALDPHGLLLPIFRVGLPTIINIPYKFVHRQGRDLSPILSHINHLTSLEAAVVWC